MPKNLRIKIDMVAVRLTCNDDLVCDICGPLNEKFERETGAYIWEHPTLGEIGKPPAHDDCRCWLGYEIA